MIDIHSRESHSILSPYKTLSLILKYSRYYVSCGVLLHLLFITCSHSTHAQFARYTNGYLQLGYSAVSEGCGRSTLSSQRGLGTERANPAGLVWQETPFRVGSSFSSVFTGMGSLLYLGGGMRIDSMSGVGAGLLRFGVDGIQNTLEWRDPSGGEDYGRIRRFGIADYALFLSYGRRLPWSGFSVGGVGKILYRDEGGFATGVGIGFDMSILYRRAEWQVCAAVRDITTTWTLWFIDQKKLRGSTVGESLNPTAERAAEGTAPSLEVGVSYLFRQDRPWRYGASGRVRASGGNPTSELIALGGVTISPAIGGWASYKDIVFLRLGAHQWQWIPYSRQHTDLISFTPTAGLGVRGWGLSIDYAFTAPLVTLSMRVNHLVSVSYSFGK